MKKALLFFTILLILVFSGFVLAGESSQLDVHTRIASEVILHAYKVEFGVYNFDTGAIGNGEIKVKASEGLRYEIILDRGLNLGMGALAGTRAMANSQSAGGYISYYIYQPNGTVEWGDNGASYPAPSVSDIGNGGNVSYIVQGNIPAGQTAPPGDYYDIVSVTVTF